METTGGGRVGGEGVSRWRSLEKVSVGGEGVSRWRPLVEVRVWEVKVCEQVEIIGGGESV